MTEVQGGGVITDHALQAVQVWTHVCETVSAPHPGLLKSQPDLNLDSLSPLYIYPLLMYMCCTYILC